MTEERTIVEKAYSHCLNNKQEIVESSICGCFNCETIFKGGDVFRTPEGITVTEDDTVICPKCSVDSIIGSASGFDINPFLLSVLHQAYIDSKISIENVDKELNKNVAEAFKDVMDCDDVELIRCKQCFNLWLEGEAGPGDPYFVDKDGNEAKIYQVKDCRFMVAVCTCGKPILVSFHSDEIWETWGPDVIEDY